MIQFYKTECTKCDWSHSEMEEIQRVSFPTNDIKIVNPVKIIPIQDSSYSRSLRKLFKSSI